MGGCNKKGKEKKSNVGDIYNDVYGGITPVLTPYFVIKENYGKI
jgi:hypothetical protein